MRSQSLTSLAGEAVRVGVARGRVVDAGTVGESVPGGSSPTPDQSDVDEIGRAMGVAEEDSGALRTSAEILEDRDRRRDSTEGAGDERSSGSPRRGPAGAPRA